MFVVFSFSTQISEQGGFVLILSNAFSFFTQMSLSGLTQQVPQQGVKRKCEEEEGTPNKKVKNQTGKTECVSFFSFQRMYY
jgi:hypothetical protein